LMDPPCSSMEDSPNRHSPINSSSSTSVCSPLSLPPLPKTQIDALIIKEKSRWTELKIEGSPSARHLHSAVAFQNKMFIFGGFSTVNLNDLHCFDFGLHLPIPFTPLILSLQKRNNGR